MDPFHIHTTYQATSEDVSHVKFLAKFQNLNFWKLRKFSLTLSYFDLGSDVITSMGNQGVAGDISEHRRSSCSSCTYANIHNLTSMIYLILQLIAGSVGTNCNGILNGITDIWTIMGKTIDTYCSINFQGNTPNITLPYLPFILCPKLTSRLESFKLPFLSLFLNFRLAFWFHPFHRCLIILILIKLLMRLEICQYNLALTHQSLVT